MKITCHSTAALLVVFLSPNAAFAGSFSPDTVRTDGMHVDLEHLRDAKGDDGMLIPLSMEMFESQQNALPEGGQIQTPDSTQSVSPLVILKELSVEKVNTAPVEPAESVTSQQTLPMPVKLVEASAPTETAEEPVSDDTFKAVVEAMTPKEPAKPLKGNRFTFYLSDEVAFAQVELSTERMKLDNGRFHVASLYSEERDSVVHGGISLDSAFTESFRLSFGARAYIALLSTENVDAFAAAIGAETAYRLPFKATPLEFSASLYYAPDILTFGAGDRAIDAQVDISLPFRARSALFAGVRFLQVDVRPEDREVDNRFHMGFRWDFK